MFKVNNKNTRKTPLASILCLTVNFEHTSHVSIVNFEHVIGHLTE